MKKFLIKSTALLLFAGFITGCEADKIVYDVDNGQALASFVGEESNLAAFEGETGVVEVQVGVTNRVNYDRAIQVSINEEFSTADPSQYTIDQSTLVIPANEFVGNIRITANSEDLTTAKEVLVLDLNSIQDGNAVDQQKNQYAVYMFRACPIVRDEFLGTYNAVEDGASQYQIGVTAGEASNELVLSNVWEVGPQSETHIFLGDDVANPVVTYPPAFPPNESNYLFDHPTYGPAYVNGIEAGSSFDSCNKIITINFRVTVGAGSFTPTNIVMTKI